MNPRTTGKITKKYLGDQARDGEYGWSRMDSVYVISDGAPPGAKGTRFSYYSNAAKGQSFAGPEEAADGIADRYAECQEGMTVDIEYTTNTKGDKTYNNIKDMMPHGSTLPASDPVASITRRVPDHLKPGTVPEEPLPDLNAPVAARGRGPIEPGLTTISTYVPNDKDWQIARSVAVKIAAEAIANKSYPTLSDYWTAEETTGTADLCNAIARYIVTGE